MWICLYLYFFSSDIFPLYTCNSITLMVIKTTTDIHYIIYVNARWGNISTYQNFGFNAKKHLNVDKSSVVWWAYRNQITQTQAYKYYTKILTEDAISLNTLKTFNIADFQYSFSNIYTALFGTISLYLVLTLKLATDTIWQFTIKLSNTVTKYRWYQCRDLCSIQPVVIRWHFPSSKYNKWIFIGKPANKFHVWIRSMLLCSIWICYV